MTRLFCWLARRQIREAHQLGYEWGWRASRAHPYADEMYVPVSEQEAT